MREKDTNEHHRIDDHQKPERNGRQVGVDQHHQHSERGTGTKHRKLAKRVGSLADQRAEEDAANSL